MQKKMKQYKNAVVTGSIAFDEIMDFPGKFIDYFHPEKLHQINISFVVNSLKKQLGGTATNISYNLSLVTQRKINILSSLGKDGDIFIDFFNHHHIDTTNLYRDPELFTASGKVITDLNDNQIWGFYYGACAKGEDIDFKKNINKNDLLIISATHRDPFLCYQMQAINLGIDYIYDPGMALTWLQPHELKEGVNHATYLIANDYEIAQITKILGLSVEDLLKTTNIITTLGSKGVLYQDTNQKLFVPAFRVKKVYDPTGAGDAFRGGFIGGLLEDYSINEALRLGNTVASFAVESYGTVNHTPTSSDIEKRLQILKNY